MKNDLKLNVSGASAQLNAVVRKVGAYRVFIFFLAVAALYGFIVWRINALSNTPASMDEQTTSTATQPHIDPDTVSKILNLQDNSVSVQTLFDAARQNPFQE